MHLRVLFAAAAVLCCCAAARADDFTYTLTGSSGGFSGTGTFSGAETATAGTYQITSISGSNTNGVISPGSFGMNDNLLTPSASFFVDPSGIAFYDQTATGVYAVRLYQAPQGSCAGSSSQYCIDVQEVNTPDPTNPTTMPISFPGTTGNTAHLAVRFALNRVAPVPSAAATPEPGSLALLGTGALALVGMGRRRFAR